MRWTTLASCCAIVLYSVLAWAPAARAWQYYNDGAGNGCVSCHDDGMGAGFEGGPSAALHSLHLSSFGISSCNACHPSGPGTTPVETYSSGDGLGCAGCHGRDYGETSPNSGNPKASAYGLRQHHANNLEFSCQGCHTAGALGHPNPLPAILPENVPPPSYGIGTNNLTDPCDSAQEDMTFDADADGLDNDGDGDPDDPNDLDCVPTTTTTFTTTTFTTLTTVTTTITVTTTSTTTTLPPGIDVGVTGTKLIIVDKLTAANKAKVVYVAKDATAMKGTTNDPAQISATFEYQVTTLGASGSAGMPGGSGWLVNKVTVAKYVNKDAPGGAGAIKVGVVKPGKLLKAVSKGLGDGGSEIDIFQAGVTTSPVDAATQFTVVDGATTVRHCGEFTGCGRKVIANGTGAKVVCKVATPGASVICP